MKKWQWGLLISVSVALIGIIGFFCCGQKKPMTLIFPFAGKEEFLIADFHSQVLGSYQREASGEAKQNLGIVYGFLPYWSVKDYQLHQSITHLSYFRLAINGKGEIEKDGGLAIYKNDDYKEIILQAKRKNIKLETTFFTTHSNEIEKLIKCRTCQDTLIENILTVVREDELDGVNLDLEYLGFIDEKTRAQVTDFIFRLKNSLNKEFPRTQLSIDVYGGAAGMNNLWDFAKLGKIIDRVMVMGYDYKTKKSTVPGPTSPTLGESIWGGNIWEDVKNLMQTVPSEKLILTVPFYGYAWQTTTGDLATAKTWPDTGQTMTYRGAQNILKDKSKKAVEKWDEKSLTPYLVFYNQEEEKWHIGFFENERSLNYKLDLIEQLHLGGMAIWALGYEGEYLNLWQTIEARF